MAITVREAMRIGGLARCRVAAGERGLDRAIDSITVMEVPDVVQWLKGSVLLLTSLYPIKDDEAAIAQLVEQLHTVNSAALAIKTKQYVQEIPQAIIEAGNRLQLPVIEIDPEVSYLEIMTPLMQLILKNDEAGAGQLDSFFKWITELAMAGKGIAAVIEAVERMTVNTITVGSDLSMLELDKGLKPAPLTYAQKNELQAAKRPIRMQRLLNGSPTPCIVTPLLINEELAGDMTCWQTHRQFNERDFIVLERTMVLIALEFLKWLTKADVEQNYKDHLLSEVLLGQVHDQKAALEKGRAFGWDLSESYDVLCIESQERESSKRGTTGALHGADRPEWKRRLLLSVQSFLRVEPSAAIAIWLKDAIVILRPRNEPLSEARDASSKPIRTWAAAVCRHLTDVYEDMTFTAGIGRSHPGFDGIHSGYTEAVQAIRLGKPAAVQGCIHFEDLGVYRILTPFPDKAVLEQLYAETVGRLADYDAVHHSNLVMTLAAYFAQNCSLSGTAEKLFIHVNTMKYRLQKIEQLTDGGIHNAERRLLLHIGLKLHQMKQAGIDS
ncbi:PucR family transcriptional regulator [Paenibacillus piri]|uniref:PucR family transcriptional regulator n=1 Tax=Paenibacillus piri TaxID=2547395 RepID=A0A4R5KTB2_9BACL|nr:PucR family transcriptional regulator [Paenibacillus piri]TDF98127.1 PucR family transcriptional regulator [Paenibacillus piri]